MKRLERSILPRVDRAFVLLGEDPHHLGVKQLHDNRLAQFRLRVGDYRILYDVYPKDAIVYILRIGHRRDIYR
ncbi:MAG: type II toxin-antitoxin system RelE/ParE family toxin [Candidatus Liptonbacteria bacterium]|nr:type II toxin-antitoxin system RelE/ParE family toxin [Candidatus Liptonbacteria bacterium]